MTKTEKTALLAKRDELIAAYEAAREQDLRHRTPETMTAAIDASRRVSEFINANPILWPKTSGFASRAGQRQAAERRSREGKK